MFRGNVPIPKNVVFESCYDPSTGKVYIIYERGFRGTRQEQLPHEKPFDFADRLANSIDVGPECPHGARITYPCAECQAQ